MGDTRTQKPKQTKVEENESQDESFQGFSLGVYAYLFAGSQSCETTLPQDPKADKVARRNQLIEKQKEYRWNDEEDKEFILQGFPYLEGFPPKNELPSAPWVVKMVGSFARTLLGSIRATVGLGEIAEALSDRERAKTFASRIGQLITNAHKVDERPVDINDYEDLHSFPIKTPRSCDDYCEDDAFARQRLQGGNCIVIEKCSEATRLKLKILDSDPSYVVLKTKVDTLLTTGKLFVVDHELLKGYEASPLDDITRYLAPSIALFEVVDDELLPIRPIGIQLSQGEKATPIFTPEDGYNWTIAKACFEAADFILQEIISHLGKSHLIMEIPLVAMNRQLPKEHPVFTLLQPHLEGTAFINWGAQELLVVKGGVLDRLHANRIEDSLALVREQTLKRMATDFSPEMDFQARRITKKDFPGRYPYRDIGLKYWEAIHAWVTEYLDLYYGIDADITTDYELKAFIKEMVEPGKMLWLKDFDSSLNKKGFLAKLLASLIYTASVLHSAVNFPQQSIMSFVPNSPSSVYAPPPIDKKERSFKDYLAYLPPLEIATRQVFLGTLLGSVYHTKLGDYEAGHFSDQRALKPLGKFQEAIEGIEAEIEYDNARIVTAWRERGKKKKDATNFGYTTLLPNNVPQSINI